MDFNTEYEEEIQSHMDNCDVNGKPEGVFTDDELKRFFNYVKTIHPKITPEALKRRSEFFKNIKNRNDDVVIDSRTKNAVIKFAVAIAKWHMCNEVLPVHVDEAISLYEAGLKTFGLHIEDGQFIDERSLKNTTDGRKIAIQKAYDKLKDDEGYVFETDLTDEAMTYGCFTSRGTIKAMIQSMILEGKVSHKNNMIKIIWNI